jgi:hypothetical protein
MQYQFLGFTYLIFIISFFSKKNILKLFAIKNLLQIIEINVFCVWVFSKS